MQMSEAKAFKGNLILEDQVLENATIRCENGRIVAIDERGVSVPGMMDYTGRYISAGFIDIHVHGGAGADYMDGSPDAIRTVNRAHAQHGTTSIFPTTTTGSFSQLDRMIASCEAVKRTWSVQDGAKIAGVHFYGPYFAEDKVGCHPPEGRRDPVKHEYEHFLSRPIVRIATCASELPGALEFFDFASQQDCLITCGHSNAAWSELEQAFARGMRHVDHFWCAMSSVSSLRPRFGTPMQAGMEQFVIANDQMSTEVIADGEHLSDDLLRFAFKVIGHGRTCLVTDANRALDCPPGEYRFGSADDGVIVYSNGLTVRAADGSLASSMCGMATMVSNMANAVGADLPKVIQMATATPARLTGIFEDVGSITLGKSADLVVLTPDITVERVIIDGKLIIADR